MRFSNSGCSLLTTTAFVLLLLLLPSVQAFLLPSSSSPSHGVLPWHRARTVLQGSSLPSDGPGEPGGLGSRRRQSRFNKAPKQQPEEPKKERFSKDGHFYTGAIGIGTYSWGDRRDGFFYGDVSLSRVCVESGCQPLAHSFLFPLKTNSTPPTPWSARK